MNHSGSSGLVECALALNMAVDVNNFTNKKAFIGEMITDDDTTIRANIKHTYQKAKLPIDVPAPRFLSDPNHRIKVMIKPIFARATKTRDNKRIKMIDALRIKKYTSLYVFQNRTGSFDKFVNNALAPVEHLFNEHSFCDSAWCWSRELEEQVDKILVHKMNMKVKSLLMYILFIMGIMLLT